MKSIEIVIIDFLSYCKNEKGLSAKTVKFYRIDFNQFIRFLIDNNHSVLTSYIDRYILRQYIQSISHFRPKTIKRKIATLKALFNFLEFEDIIPVSPFRKIKTKIKEPLALPKIMSLNEITCILQTVYKSWSISAEIGGFPYLEKMKDVIIIELLFATGARVSEISGLKIENIDLKSWNIKILGKGSKERLIQVCNTETKRILNKYYYHFKEKIQLSGGYFLLNRLHKQLSEQSIRSIVKKYSKKAGISRNITPHVFRHSFATLLLEKSVDIKYIQHLLGHSSIVTTQIYTHVNREKQREILSLKHPRGNIRIATWDGYRIKDNL